jgi:hypothetical protein
MSLHRASIPFVTLLALLCLPVPTFAQSSGATTASQALYCVRSTNWLQPPLKSARRIKLAYIRDAKSHTGEEHWVLAIYQGGSQGQAFDLIRKKFGQMTEFNLVNNALFFIMKGTFNFSGPPRAGLGTADELQSNIQKAMRSRTLIVDTLTLRRRSTAVACKSILQQ